MKSEKIQSVNLENDYIFLDLIKSTEYQMIFLYKDKQSDKKVIVRQFHGENKAYEKLIDIDQVNIPRVYSVTSEVSEDNKDTTVIEEYFEGKNLEDYLKDHILSENEAVKIVTQVLAAAATLHKNEIVHRDIKAKNILIDDKLNVRLIDYNASRLYKETAKVDTINLGTDGYAAPEQYGIGQSDGRTDIYAIGVLFNYLLTGGFPSKKLHNGIYKNIIKKAISTNKEKRYESANEFKNAIIKCKYKRTFSIVASILIIGCAFGITAFAISAKKEKEAELIRQKAQEEQRLREEENYNNLLNSINENSSKLTAMSDGVRVDVETQLEQIRKEEEIAAAKQIQDEIDNKKQNELLDSVARSDGKVILKYDAEYMKEKLAEKIKTTWNKATFFDDIEELKQIEPNIIEYHVPVDKNKDYVYPYETYQVMDDAINSIFKSVVGYIDPNNERDKMVYTGLAYREEDNYILFTFYYY